MGVQLSNIIKAEDLEFKQLSGRVIGIDAFNVLYQFLASIRQPDGTPLMDSYGRVTSHLTGLFYRTVKLMEFGIEPVFVFDGKPPEYKRKTIESRKKTRQKAETQWRTAQKEGDFKKAKKFAQASSRLTSEMLDEAKALLSALGIPSIEAPSEGEAQAAHMCKKGELYAVASQDFDSLLFGAPRTIRNLTVSRKRKVPGRSEYIEVKPEIIDLKKALNGLGISQEQLILIGLLIGNDFEPGVSGIGPKKALDIVKEHPDLESLLGSEIKDKIEGLDFHDVYEIFASPEVTDDYLIEKKELDIDEVKKILCSEHNFSKDRVSGTLEKLEKALLAGRQSKLEKWF